MPSLIVSKETSNEMVRVAGVSCARAGIGTRAVSFKGAYVGAVDGAAKPKDETYIILPVASVIKVN